MKTRHLLALLLLGACTDPAVEQGSGPGGKGDTPNAAQLTSFE
jgi:hypothetical protein